MVQCAPRPHPRLLPDVNNEHASAVALPRVAYLESHHYRSSNNYNSSIAIWCHYLPQSIEVESELRGLPEKVWDTLHESANRFKCLAGATLESHHLPLQKTCDRHCHCGFESAAQFCTRVRLHCLITVFHMLRVGRVADGPENPQSVGASE